MVKYHPPLKIFILKNPNINQLIVADSWVVRLCIDGIGYDNFV